MDNTTGLAAGRIVVGLVSLIAPRLATKGLLLDAQANPSLPFAIRLFGSREVALGAATLVTTGEARRQLVDIGIAVDAADVLTGLAALRGTVSKKAAISFTLIAAGATASGLLSREKLG